MSVKGQPFHLIHVRNHPFFIHVREKNELENDYDRLGEFHDEFEFKHENMSHKLANLDQKDLSVFHDIVLPARFKEVGDHPHSSFLFLHVKFSKEEKGTF